MKEPTATYFQKLRRMPNNYEAALMQQLLLQEVVIACASTPREHATRHTCDLSS